MKRRFYIALYRFAVWTEYARPRFLDFQYDLMFSLVAFRNRILRVKPNPDTTNRVDEIYTHRYENWGKYVFLEKPESDWFLKWGTFIKIL